MIESMQATDGDGIPAGDGWARFCRRCGRNYRHGPTTDRVGNPPKAKLMVCEGWDER